uniref:Uncharacterized protein n=1 Tax=Physcomitrium patens TaxID=3218 RepID=A9SNB2_PHYPA|nr:hypothetical protein PHYPA_010885 [Physcomitrium patens]
MHSVGRKVLCSIKWFRAIVLNITKATKTCHRVLWIMRHDCTWSSGGHEDQLDDVNSHKLRFIPKFGSSINIAASQLRFKFCLDTRPDKMVKTTSLSTGRMS